jgi:hypothetical protein
MAAPKVNDPTVVDPAMVGEVWTNAKPSEDPVLYGHVSIDPTGPVAARSAQTLTLTYTVGRHGMDDTGSLRVILRSVGDSGRLQVDDPAAPNYATAVASNGSGLSTTYVPTGGWRPRSKALQVTVVKGCLREGDTVTVVIGDTSGGSPGAYMQTHCETNFEYKVVVDVCATGHYLPLTQVPSVSIVPGPPAVWRAVLPTLRRPGETFQLGIKAEDLWGNPTDQAEMSLRIRSNLTVNNLPETLEYPLGERSMTLENLSLNEPGLLWISIESADGETLAAANPLVIENGSVSGYWADLHGQSGESIGLNTSYQYFQFARDCAFLDASSHQANDFQINNTFWAYLNELTAKFHKDNRFVTFPGYEWSGNTAVGGDRNVFFREEGRQIHRSSHALLPDRSDIATDANDAGALFEALKDEDCVVFAHVGGRYADIDFAHDGKIERSMELHSAWGTFEWLIEDCFRLGHRVGVVANSDGHKGRPGASYPGASQFGAYGGLTCFVTDDLTRDGIFGALRRRHHYGTTGNRIHLDVKVHCKGGAERFFDDPKDFPDAGSEQTSQLMMGDIARTSDTTVTLNVHAISATPIERIEIRNATTVLETIRGYTEDDLGSRIRVAWSGAEYRGRGRETNWIGKVAFEGQKISRMSKVNSWNHERRLECVDDSTVEFNAITTGNFSGFDAWLDGTDGTVDVSSNLVSARVPMADIGFEDSILDAGGLRRQIKLYRLPDENTHRELSASVEISLDAAKDDALWVSVYTEDGFQAWSSPVYLIP